MWEALPKWQGHAQPLKPLWGYENEADPKVVEKKIEAAVSHGVNVFIYDWYWYGGGHSSRTGSTRDADEDGEHVRHGRVCGNCPAKRVAEANRADSDNFCYNFAP